MQRLFLSLSLSPSLSLPPWIPCFWHLTLSLTFRSSLFHPFYWILTPAERLWFMIMEFLFIFCPDCSAIHFLPVWEGALVKTLIKFASEWSFPWLQPLNQSKGQAQWHHWSLLKYYRAANDEQQVRRDEGSSSDSIHQLINHRFHNLWWWFWLRI